MEELTSEGDVTLYDRKTKQSRTIHWGPGHSIEWWWQEGNGSCDCNRHLYFWDWDPPRERRKAIGKSRTLAYAEGMNATL